VVWEFTLERAGRKIFDGRRYTADQLPFLKNKK
jgi:hypothetical protein